MPCMLIDKVKHRLNKTLIELSLGQPPLDQPPSGQPPLFTRATWGTLKSSNIDKHRQNPPDTRSTNPGASFVEGAKAPQAAATQKHGAGRP